MTRKKRITRRPPGTLLLDDRWLNQVESWLDATARFCERAFGRKPTIEDLRRPMTTVLAAGLVSTRGSRTVIVAIKNVSFETTRRPKVPKKLRAGHVLAIPLGKGTFAFGRVMKTKSPWLIGVIVEVFAQTQSKPRCDRAVRASGRLFGRSSSRGQTPLRLKAGHERFVVDARQGPRR